MRGPRGLAPLRALMYHVGAAPVLVTWVPATVAPLFLPPFRVGFPPEGGALPYPSIRHLGFVPPESFPLVTQAASRPQTSCGCPEARRRFALIELVGIGRALPPLDSDPQGIPQEIPQGFVPT